MNKSKAKIAIVQRNLLILAVSALIVAVITFIFALRQWFKWLPMPEKVTLEMHQALRDALAAAWFVCIPLFGCFYLLVAICIGLELLRLRKSEAELDKNDSYAPPEQ
jgi:hypothetical protein